ncbi:hypothetical protein M569_01828, partial [Genlisea aurea]
FESVPDLEKSMYVPIEGFPCVRLLNLSGEIGCSNPGRSSVVAPVVRLKDVEDLVGSAAILVSLEEFETIIGRHCFSFFLLGGKKKKSSSYSPSFTFSRFSNSSFYSKVAGILVKSGARDQNGLNGFSPDIKFPQAELAPYKSNFQWNPAGSGIMRNAYDFPVFLLSKASTTVLEEVATANENGRKFRGEVVAEFDIVMQTTKSGTRDSDSCLKEGTCLPLGGYSVWSALPPINPSSSSNVKPLIMTMASMDSASFFRDQSLGAESPISGLIALLAVVDSLSRLGGLDKLNKQFVFVVFTGEAWGYLGSRRFFLESEQMSAAMKGLDLAAIETIIEIGSVGKSSPTERTFFAHTTGDASSLNGTLRAFQNAQSSSVADERINIKAASKTNPGIPPSSLMTFLSKNPNASGVVVEDFDYAFSDAFYHSHLDDSSNINSSSIVAAATLVARTLYILAGGEETPSSVMNINATLVEELVGCLLDCDPGLSCDLAKHYISPSSAATCPNNYVGVVLGDPSDPTAPYAGDVSRLVWNFMAEKASVPSKNATSSSCPDECRGEGESCIRKEPDGRGVCVVSTTRYVPAYSTRLKYESGSWTVLPPNVSDRLGSEDPVWTESNWDAIQVRVYKVQNGSYDAFILVSGIVVTVLSYVLVIISRAVIRKAVKRD